MVLGDHGTLVVLMDQSILMVLGDHSILTLSQLSTASSTIPLCSPALSSFSHCSRCRRSNLCRWVMGWSLGWG